MLQVSHLPSKQTYTSFRNNKKKGIKKNLPEIPTPQKEIKEHNIGKHSR